MSSQRPASIRQFASRPAGFDIFASADPIRVPKACMSDIASYLLDDYECY